MKRFATHLSFVLSLAVTSAGVAGERLSFVACPIVRDTSTVPCWLAENQGQLYFLTLQTDVSAPVNPPWLGHRVLVEGEVSDEPSICGGRVLKPLTLSVMTELDASCNTVLTAKERYDLTFEPPRPPGNSKGRLEFGDPAARDATATAVQRAGADAVLGYCEAGGHMRHPLRRRDILSGGATLSTKSSPAT
jgi:hypothetical protein